jgi:hypothetical protein
MTMRRTIGIAVIMALALGPNAAHGQRNVIAAGRTNYDEAPVLQLGRELRADNRRLGLRIHVDYLKHDVTRQSGVYFPSDTGPFITRTATYDTQRRSMGLWASATYAPFSRRLKPYLMASVGVQDHFWHFERSALDSATIDGVAWPNMEASFATYTSVETAVRTGAGVSARIAKLRLFVEAQNNGLPYPKRLDRWSLLTVGLRF